MIIRTALAAWLALCVATTPAGAQSARVLLQEGLRAYRDLEFAAAAQLLSRALETEHAALDSPEQTRARMYLGAAEVFRDNQSAAAAVFRTLILDDPQFRPDPLVFPPRVTDVFAETLKTTKAAAVEVPARSRFVAGVGSMPVAVHASSPHRVDVYLLAPDGKRVVTLYAGDIVDSVVTSWNGLNEQGNPPPTGTYQLEVASLASETTLLRSVRIPLRITAEAADTVPTPPPPPLKPSHKVDLRFLGAGLVLGAGLALPAVFGSVRGETPRIALGASIATLGLVAGLRGQRAVPDSAAEADWQRHVEELRHQNELRRARPLLDVQSGAAPR